MGPPSTHASATVSEYSLPAPPPRPMSATASSRHSSLRPCSEPEEDRGEEEQYNNTTRARGTSTMFWDAERRASPLVNVFAANDQGPDYGARGHGRYGRQTNMPQIRCKDAMLYPTAKTMKPAREKNFQCRQKLDDLVKPTVRVKPTDKHASRAYQMCPVRNLRVK